MSLDRRYHFGFKILERLGLRGCAVFEGWAGGAVVAVVAMVAMVAQSVCRAVENAPASPAGGSPPSIATPKPPTEVEKWFAQVDGSQEAAFQAQVIKPFEAGVADLKARYLAALDAAIAKASAASQLNEALAFRAERTAFEKAQNVAPDDDTTPAGVKALRAAFRQQLTQLERDRTLRAKTLFAQYDAILAQNQTLLTQRQRLDDALLLKTKRDEIALAWLGALPPKTVSVADHPEPAQSGSALPASKDQPFVNSLGMKFVPVPGTDALFCIWDTRVKDYAHYARVKKVDDAWKKQERDGVPVGREPDDPVLGVNWDDARAFCQWLTKRETSDGKLPKGTTYRLPTDEEWSRAAGLAKEDGATPNERSGKNQVNFPWGTEFPPSKANVGNYADAAYHGKFPNGAWLNGYTDGYATTSPVGSFPANENGLYDMGGNVWQWCEDPFEPASAERVLRGGSWHDYDRSILLSSSRIRNVPGLRNNTFGFRCVVGMSAR